VVKVISHQEETLLKPSLLIVDDDPMILENLFPKIEQKVEE